MRYIYYIDGEKFTTDREDIPWEDIYSPNDNTSAFENLLTGHKIWCKRGFIRHCLIGPATIWPDGSEYFFINGEPYENIHDWLKDHPNPTLYFHKIGVFTETDKVLWYLQN
jgi:hypothetical protein